MELSEYKILRRLGAGGMAEVFLADKVGLAGFSRTVAIKTILAAGAPADAISLFLDEARVASGLSHPGIVQTLDLGYEHETLFIVMEFVPGPPLSRMIYEMKRAGSLLPNHVVAYIGAKIAAALDFAHRRVTAPDGQPLNMVHRDVSPQNILVTRHAVVKLTDFGVARASIQMHKTKTGQVRGKAAYMAPEQVRAKALDGRTDMFALGLVLYEALTCIRPYQRKSDINSMRAILSEKVPPIHDANPDVPSDLVAVIMKSLEKKPQNRFAHCGELEAALQATYAHLRRSAIEEEIADIMNDLFGEQRWEDQQDGPLVEAWQPTINVDKNGQESIPRPQRIAGQSMSPEIAKLLGLTPGGPNELGAALAAPVGGQADSGELISVVPYSADDPYSGPQDHLGAEGPHTKPPQRRVGTLPLPGTSTPDPPMISAYNLTPTGVQGRAFTEVPIPTAAVSSPGGMAISGDSLSLTGARTGKLRDVAMIALAVALLLIGAVLYSVARSPEVTSEPGSDKTNPSFGGGFTATAGEKVPPPPIPKRPEAETLIPEPPVRRPAVSRPPVKRRQPKTTPEPTPPVEKPALSPADFQKRALALFNRAKAKNDGEMNTALGQLLVDMQLGREPTAADRRLLERAAKRLQ